MTDDMDFLPPHLKDTVPSLPQKLLPATKALLTRLNTTHREIFLDRALEIYEDDGDVSFYWQLNGVFCYIYI